jgi:hypothetical protein
MDVRAALYYSALCLYPVRRVKVCFAPVGHLLGYHPIRTLGSVIEYETRITPEALEAFIDRMLFEMGAVRVVVDGRIVGERIRQV